ncbi:MAG: glycoside hydrolase family 3 C-terminal domain-containing protein [Lachnospiraceae bacterium]|nr:glycoside hydrolase family 3 C-terminal domain-containing protein [Lachnospiraceae bacterium]
MDRWARYRYLPGTPLGKNGLRATGCAEHINLSRSAASQGAVLLKNNNSVLPLPGGSRVAAFGKGIYDHVKGGGGSGDVTCAYSKSVAEGLIEKESEGVISTDHRLLSFYRDYVENEYRKGALPGMIAEPKVPADLLAKAKAFTDTALIVISRYSGEGWDRNCATDEETSDNEENDAYAESFLEKARKIFQRGDYYLSREEERMIKLVSRSFKNTVVLLNTGGVTDSSWFKDNDDISSVLIIFQGGMEGGSAAADLLCGDVTPSGKLTDTWASDLSDYPSYKSFHESADYVKYTEDIFIGYRYFETIPGASEKVNYPFGFGLSYTDFSIRYISGRYEKGVVSLEADVINTGRYPGREVVQLYVSQPKGMLEKASRILAAFKKTSLLSPGARERVILSFDIKDIASYDDTGKVRKCAWILEKGTYSFFLGNDVRAKSIDFNVDLRESLIVKETEDLLPPHKLDKRLKADGSYEEMETSKEKPLRSVLKPMSPEECEGPMPVLREVSGMAMDWARIKPTGVPSFEDVADGSLSLDEFVDSLSEDDLISLLGGQPNTGCANTFGFGNLVKQKVPNIMTADGPAGVRINKECGINTTAWPCATLLASSWDPELIEQVGKAGGLELKENNLGLWLTPGLCIHRNPLCGRNFEYYSEDPFVSGVCAAAMVRGIQSNRVGACPKHFACNNKETNRKSSDSVISEKALREIYLKGFEVMLKYSDPWVIMSSYNLINGVHASESRDLLTGILRNEWKFEGFVTTDWWTYAEHYLEIKAGCDLKMGCGYPDRVKTAVRKGAIDRSELETCAKRILSVILRYD